jgi:hypothetical protein
MDSNLQQSVAFFLTALGMFLMGITATYLSPEARARRRSERIQDEEREYHHHHDSHDESADCDREDDVRAESWKLQDDERTFHRHHMDDEDETQQGEQ